MQKPDLNRIWETFIKIPLNCNPIDMIRFQVFPLISRFKDTGIRWYCFLIHDRGSGVPTSKDDPHLYFHVRFELDEDTNPEEFLLDYCVMTRKTEPIENIAGINKSLLRDEQIEEAWKIIGEQSEWVINMLNIYKPEVDIPPNQIAQFLHYYFNMTQLGIKCPNCEHFVHL